MIRIIFVEKTISSTLRLVCYMKEKLSNCQMFKWNTAVVINSHSGQGQSGKAIACNLLYSNILYFSLDNGRWWQSESVHAFFFFFTSFVNSSRWNRCSRCLCNKPNLHIGYSNIVFVQFVLYRHWLNQLHAYLESAIGGAERYWFLLEVFLIYSPGVTCKSDGGAW